MLWKIWEADLASYHALYSPAPGQLCGEGSTMYTFLPEFDKTYERLFAYNPDLKFIYIMRSPVERVSLQLCASPGARYGQSAARGGGVCFP